ncbi:hypothetical protein SNEBB_000092 [Seison nebaliae]|nr:hypothetical protein SNEBB_000092 [Seison nebaliae]
MMRFLEENRNNPELGGLVRTTRTTITLSIMVGLLITTMLLLLAISMVVLTIYFGKYLSTLPDNSASGAINIQGFDSIILLIIGIGITYYQNLFQ